MNRRPRSITPIARAFTLVELIAAMVVVGVIGVFGALTMQRAAAANTQIAARGILYADASALMDRIVRKVQSTPVRASSNPVAPSIASFSAATVAWDDLSALAYDATAQTVTLRDVAAGDATTDNPVLAGNVTAFTVTPSNESDENLFTLLGVSTLDATQGAAVRRVTVQFTLTRQGQSVTLRSRAFTRCTMSRAGA